MTQIGEDKQLVCDFCGVEDEVQYVNVQYTPNSKTKIDFEFKLCTDCIIEWMGEDL